MDERSPQAVTTGVRAPAPDGEGGPARPVSPLQVSGLVVSPAALVAALRLYLPQLSTIEPLDDGRFLLQLAGDAPGDHGIKE